MTAASRSWRSWAIDFRVWLGIAITVGALYYAFRGVDMHALWSDISGANPWWLILVAAPAQVWSIYIRAVRWRYLTRGVTDCDVGQSFRATAVGYMANNIFPLRMGEVIRAWYLGRDTSSSTTALLGTLIVERTIDVVFVLALAAVLVGAQGARAAGIDPAEVMVPLCGLVAGMIGVIVALRFAPDATLRRAHRVMGFFLPQRFRERAENLLTQVAAGLAGLRSARDLAWVCFHSAVLWWICIVLTFWAALRSVGIDLGGPLSEFMAAGRVMVWVGLAVALPSAPGFVGPFHAACRAALVPLGVPKAQALALGTLAHLVFWVTITGLGLIVLRFRGGHLEDALSAAEEEASPAGEPAPGDPQAPLPGKDPSAARR